MNMCYPKAIITVICLHRYIDKQNVLTHANSQSLIEYSVLKLMKRDNDSKIYVNYLLKNWPEFRAEDTIGCMQCSQLATLISVINWRVTSVDHNNSMVRGTFALLKVTHVIKKFLAFTVKHWRWLVPVLCQVNPVDALLPSFLSSVLILFFQLRQNFYSGHFFQLFRERCMKGTIWDTQVYFI